MRFADPERLVAGRSGAMSWPRRRRRCATSPAASLERTRMTTASLIRAGSSSRSCTYDNNCGKQNLNRALKAYRTAEKKAADEAIGGFEEDDE